MKKLVEKDKKVRKLTKEFEKKILILKTISNCSNLSNLTRFNAFFKLNQLLDKTKTSKTYISNRCVNTMSKKKFHKLTRFSRIFFLKLARNNHINGLQKSSW